METENYYAGISHIVHISSFQSKSCEHCSASIGGSSDNMENSINHYISKHGYKLLHVGPISDFNNDNSTLYGITAVLGNEA